MNFSSRFSFGTCPHRRHQKQDNGDVRVLEKQSVEASLKGHPDLVAGFMDMIKGNAVLFGTYVSSQWLALSRLTAVYRPVGFALLASGMCLVHLLVLLQQAWSFRSGLEHAERLAERKLLRLAPQASVSMLFGAVVLLMAVLLIAGAVTAWPEATKLNAIGLSCVCLGLHARHLCDTTASYKKWREPQVESKEYLSLTLPLLEATSETPRKLTRVRAQKWLIAMVLKTTFAWLAASVLGVTLLDMAQLRGQVVKYDVGRGHLTSPGSSEAFHNTLLLDTNADSLTLNAEVLDGMHELRLEVRHPLLNISEEVASTHPASTRSPSLQVRSTAASCCWPSGRTETPTHHPRAPGGAGHHSIPEQLLR